MLAVFKLTTENITTLTSSGIHGTKRAATSSSSCSGRDAYNLLHGATRHDAELKPGRELQRRRRPRAGAKPEIDDDDREPGELPCRKQRHRCIDDHAKPEQREEDRTWRSHWGSRAAPSCHSHVDTDAESPTATMS